MDSKLIKARVIAFYLPQFHPIPENNKWWGEGFTEWTNVGKAKPLFKGHYQPRVPADLGYYDLRIPEIREKQVELAKEAGIEGFCYWHYWFGNGKRLLERPFNEVLNSGKPDFPFCLGWANETWSGIWHGNPQTILAEQTYPGLKDYEKHFDNIKQAFSDLRYIQVDGKPLFLVYRPLSIPNLREFTDCWNTLAINEGLQGFYFVGVTNDVENENDEILNCFDALVINRLPTAIKKINNISKRIFRKLRNRPRVFEYSKVIEYLVGEAEYLENNFPMILPNWDNSPRSGMNSLILNKSTPELFNTHIRQVLNTVKNKKEQNKIIFLKSWNEWAEGNYVEPDLVYGKHYLDILKSHLID